jgi:hypothetical protein
MKSILKKIGIILGLGSGTISGQTILSEENTSAFFQQ